MGGGRKGDRRRGGMGLEDGYIEMKDEGRQLMDD